MLRGRRDECAALDGLLDGARGGRSGALVVRGDAGVGKTALLEYAIASAADLGIVRALGVESERELAFAALHQMFTEMGAGAFAERTKRELLATGQRVHKRTVETRDALTVQEAQVARLARDGIPNADIGARLFIGRRTVEYHLHKVFTKLGISSRHQLEHALPREPMAAAQT
jgi:DNA-binding CsgD family transcriptional regulator